MPQSKTIKIGVIVAAAILTGRRDDDKPVRHTDTGVGADRSGGSQDQSRTGSEPPKTPVTYDDTGSHSDTEVLSNGLTALLDDYGQLIGCVDSVDAISLPLSYCEEVM